MGLNNEQFDRIMREYEEIRNSNRKITEEKQQLIERRLPELKAFDNRIATLCVSRAISEMDGKREQAEDIADEIAMLRVRRRSELESIGFSEEDIEPVYTCRDCCDTGYITTPGDGKIKCHCLKKREMEILYRQSGIQDLLKRENFSTLSYEYCTGEDLTRLETAVRICKEFVADFGKVYRNIVFCGTVGTGKSFLSCCIAHELIENCHSVLYMSSQQLFDTMADFRFGSEKTGRADLARDIYGCELLILDDLGTELANSFVASSLFTIINERNLRQNPTIISTNLDIGEMRDRYSDRVISRITGSYDFVRLSGPDVRTLL